MDRKLSQFRMDFVPRLIKIDESTRTATFAMDPDPRRYEWKEIEGKRYLVDRLDHSLFPEQLIHEALGRLLEGKELYHQPPEIADAEAYVNSRKGFIERMLDGLEDGPAIFIDKSEEFLQTLPVGFLGFVIVSVDIVGSTALATRNPEAYRRLIPTVSYELSEIIPQFRGHVLKHSGDGLIAYFPEPSFITKNDLAIDCALTMRRLIYDVLNPSAKSRGLPPVEIRIGIDSGRAYIRTIGSPKAKRHRDIIGAVVNLAVKIQSLARHGDVCLGDTTLRNLHTSWRLICEPIKTGRSWKYIDLDGKVYGVHRVKIN